MKNKSIDFKLEIIGDSPVFYNEDASLSDFSKKVALYIQFDDDEIQLVQEAIGDSITMMIVAGGEITFQNPHGNKILKLFVKSI